MNEQQRLDIATAFIRALESKAKHESMADKIDESTLENACRVQDASIEIMTERGEEIVGWKVALTSKAMQEFCGVDHPLSGAIFKSKVHPSSHSLDLAGSSRRDPP